MLSTERLSLIFMSQNRQKAAVSIGLLLGMLSGVTALALVLVGPVVTFIGLAALVVGLVALSSLDASLLLLLASLSLLPFATLPFKVALTLSLIDTTLGLFVVVYLFQWMTGERRDLKTTPVHVAILLFVLIMIFAFVRGVPNAPLTPGVLRRFIALMANVILALIIVDVVRNTPTLHRIGSTFMIIGTLSALLGAILWFMPDNTANELLNRLERIGYPGGNVLRYREDGVQIGVERAIGTWVDPNAFGGFLMMVGALIAPQVVARRPLIGSRVLASGLLAIVMLTLFLTDSRGSMLGFLAGVGLVAVIRYRKLIWLIVLAALIALLLPPTQAYIDRLVAGIQGEDLATQMRFGEYKDAFRLIQRYPVLGVGFGAPPDIDLYIGVASTYLTIMANAGLVGLLAFVTAIGSVLVYGFRHRRIILQDDELNDIALGLLGGIIGALVGGIFDHFYFNIEFQATSLTLWLFVGLFLATIRLGAIHEDKERTLS